MHHLVGELKGRGIAQAVAISIDRLARPVAIQPKLSPTPDVLLGPAGKLGMPSGAHPAAGPLRTEDAVELRHADLCDRGYLVHHDDHVVLPSDYIVGAGEYGDSRWSVAFQALIRKIVIETRLMRDADVGQAEVKAGNCICGCLQIVLDGNAGLVFIERIPPPAAQR